MKNTDSPFPICFQSSCSHVSFSGQRLFVSTSTGRHTKNSHRLAKIHFSFCVADKPSYPYAGLAECARRVSIRRPPPWGFKACRTTFVSRPNSFQNPVPSSWNPPFNSPPAPPRIPPVLWKTLPFAVSNFGIIFGMPFSRFRLPFWFNFGAYFLICASLFRALNFH